MSKGLRTYQIGQITPAPDLTNAICVTLKSHVDIKSTGSKRSIFTISGLYDYSGGAERLAPLKQSDGKTAFSSNVFSASASRDPKHVTIKDGLVTFYVTGNGRNVNSLLMQTAPPKPTP